MPALILFLSLLVPSLVSAEWIKDEAELMGTKVSVQLWHADPESGQQLAKRVFSEFRRIEQLMSPYLEESELSQLNRLAASGPVEASQELFDLLTTAQGFSELTEGAFDITFASIGQLYDYREGVIPTEKEIDERLPGVNYRHVQLDQEKRTVRYVHAGVSIDLGGIAKGYEVDRSIDLLQAAGVEHALVTAGGDSRLIGDHRGRPWQIGIQAPREEGEVAVMLPLINEAISTSGDYERYFIQDGVRHHHIISPATGRSASEVQSVSILGPEATLTDALSTSLFVMGPQAGLALIEGLPAMEAVIIDRDGRMLYSSGLKAAEPIPADR